MNSLEIQLFFGDNPVNVKLGVSTFRTDYVIKKIEKDQWTPYSYYEIVLTQRNHTVQG